MRSVAEHLDALAEQGSLDAGALARGRAIAGIAPDAARWRTFLDRALLIGAALFLATAVIFFVAHNWSQLGRYGKLILLGAVVAVFAGLGIWRGPSTRVGEAALLAATLATGAFLALIGQTYQTGADPWQLFARGAVVVLPWALAANGASIWVAVLVIANVALVLFVEQERPRWLGSSDLTTLNLLAILNAVALALAELREGRGPATGHRILPRAAGIFGLAASTIGFLAVFFMSRIGFPGNAFLFLGGIAAVAFVYHTLRRDLLLLAVAVFAGIACVTGVAVRVLSNMEGLLLVALMLIGMSGVAAVWLRGVAKRWEAT